MKKVRTNGSFMFCSFCDANRLRSIPLALSKIRPLFWSFVVAFNLAGATDIIVDYYHANQVGLPAMAGQLGATYAIPIIYVPVPMITHIVAFYFLLRPLVSKSGRGC